MSSRFCQQRTITKQWTWRRKETGINMKLYVIRLMTTKMLLLLRNVISRDKHNCSWQTNGVSGVFRASFKTFSLGDMICVTLNWAGMIIRTLLVARTSFPPGVGICHPVKIYEVQWPFLRMRSRKFAENTWNRGPIAKIAYPVLYR